MIYQVAFTILTAVAMLISPCPASAQLRPVGPPVFPQTGETEGPWTAISHSATYLLNDGYVLNSVAEAFSYSSLVPDTKLTTTHTYFLTKGSSIVRCEEFTFQRNYVQCWEFKPKLATGYNDTGALDFLPGTWKSTNSKIPVTWVFTDDTVTTSELQDNKVHDSSYSINDKDLLVQVYGGMSIRFTFENGSHMSYRSQYYNGQTVELQKQ